MSRHVPYSNDSKVPQTKFFQPLLCLTSGILTSVWLLGTSAHVRAATQATTMILPESTEIPAVFAYPTTNLVSLAASTFSASTHDLSDLITTSHLWELSQGDRLPRRVASRVRRDLANRLGVPRNQLSIIRYSRETWSDSCLGLGKPDESCLQALVPGWQVELTDGRQNWIYRTDEMGQTIRLQDDSSETSELPDEVGDRVLAVASEEANTPIADLKIVQSRSAVFDGCLGIDPGDGVCTQIAIPGWKVIVAGDTGSWIYHTDQTGSDIRLNETASQHNSDLVPEFIPQEAMPPSPGEGVLFQATLEGGISGSSRKILLLEDGQVVQFVDDQGVANVIELNRLSPQQVQAFERLLQEQRFANLNQLSYPAASGAADYMTVTLTSRGSAIRYADIVEDQLPSALQQVIQAWDQVISDDRGD